MALLQEFSRARNSVTALQAPQALYQVLEPLFSLLVRTVPVVSALDPWLDMAQQRFGNAI